MANDIPENINVLVHDEKGVLFDGTANAVSSSNEQGPFDILVEHTNFITLIKEKLIIHDTSGEKKEFAVAGGILHCFTSKVEVYLGIKIKKTL